VLIEEWVVRMNLGKPCEMNGRTDLYLSYGCKKDLFSMILYIRLIVGIGLGDFHASLNLPSTVEDMESGMENRTQKLQKHEPILYVLWYDGISKTSGVYLREICTHVSPHR